MSATIYAAVVIFIVGLAYAAADDDLVLYRSECDFSATMIQKVVNNFEKFKNDIAIDPLNPTTKIHKFSMYRSWEGYDSIDIRTDAQLFISEDLNTDHDAVHGFSNLANGVYVNYDKTEDGYDFVKPGGDKLFHIPVRHLDGIENDQEFSLDSEKRSYFNQILSLRKSLHAFKRKMDKQKFQVSLFDLHPLSNGYYAQYHEVGLPGISQRSMTTSGKEHRSGSLKCEGLQQDYDLVDDVVTLKGVPYAPIYH